MKFYHLSSPVKILSLLCLIQVIYTVNAEEPLFSGTSFIYSEYFINTSVKEKENMMQADAVFSSEAETSSIPAAESFSSKGGGSETLSMSKSENISTAGSEPETLYSLNAETISTECRGIETLSVPIAENISTAGSEPETLYSLNAETISTECRGIETLSVPIAENISTAGSEPDTVSTLNAETISTEYRGIETLSMHNEETLSTAESRSVLGKKQKLFLKAEAHYSSISGFSEKITAEFSSLKFSVLDFRRDPFNKREDKTVVNIYSPVFSAGRVKKKGLYKELENPSYWYAGSETYTDKPDIAEDSSFNRNGHWGVILRPLNESLFFIDTDENDDYKIIRKGGGFSIGSDSILGISAVLAESTGLTGASEEWYENRDIEYGDKIYNGAFQLDQKGRILNHSLCAGTSFGSCFKTGSFFRYHPQISLGPLTLFILISLSDSNYRRPEKGYPAVKFRRGVKAEYVMNRNFEAESGYNTDLYHTEYLSEIENRIGENIFLRLKYDADFFFLNFDAARKNSLEDLLYIQEDSLSFKTGLRGDYFYFSVNPGFKFRMRDAVSRSITAESSFTDGVRDIRLKHKRERGEKLNCITKGYLGLKGENLSFYSEAEYETLDEKGYNLKSVFRFSTGCRFKY